MVQSSHLLRKLYHITHLHHHQPTPVNKLCPKCSHNAKAPYTFSGKGEIYSFTTVRDAPAGFEEYAPYAVALIKLEEGPLVTAQLTDWHDKPPEIGTPVEMVTRRLRQDGPEERGIIVYGYKFRPVLQKSS